MADPIKNEVELVLKWESVKNEAINLGMQLLTKFDDFIIINNAMVIYEATNLQDIENYLKKFADYCEEFFKDNRNDL